MRASALLVGIGLMSGLLPVRAEAEQYILYLHGRTETTWKHGTATVAGWTNVTFQYDGNASLANEAVSTVLNDAFTRYCSGENLCIAVCFSAGCMRALKALDDITAQGVQPTLLWMEAAASAAGGSALAETSSSFGGQPIDYDLHRSTARNKWAHIQDAVAPATMYHLAGKRDTCVWAGCGNWLLPPGLCDGAVCVDSAGGASVSGSFYDGCKLAQEPGLYPGRKWDADFAPCTGLEKNHAGVAKVAPTVVSQTGSSR